MRKTSRAALFLSLALVFFARSLDASAFVPVVDGVETRYVLDGANVLLELDGSNQLKAANTHAGLDNLLVRDVAGASSPYFLHQDGLGSTAALTDSTGNVIERYRYSAFGKIEVLNPDFSPKPGGPSLVANTWTGREWDPETGLYYFRARYYSPDMGRFISQDPIGFGGGDENFLAYCSNNPFNLIDPFGLKDYNALETQMFLARAYGDAVTGPIQGLLNIRSNSTDPKKFDFKGNGDTFFADGHRMQGDEFGNYIAGFEGQAYDQIYSPFGLPFAQAAVKAAGVGYHAVDFWNPSGYDPLDRTGFPAINAGEQAAKGFLGSPIDRNDYSQR